MQLKHKTVVQKKYLISSYLIRASCVLLSKLLYLSGPVFITVVILSVLQNCKEQVNVKHFAEFTTLSSPSFLFVTDIFCFLC